MRLTSLYVGDGDLACMLCLEGHVLRLQRMLMSMRAGHTGCAYEGRGGRGGGGEGFTDLGGLGGLSVASSTAVL